MVVVVRGLGRRAGVGVDPKYVWDAEADPVVAAIIDSGQTTAVNKLLKTWTKNGQALPAGLPTQLRDFMEHARQLPTWTDTAKLKDAVNFNQKRGLYWASPTASSAA
nr:hypothetical protein [Parafrankia sp. CH37]